MREENDVTACLVSLLHHPKSLGILLIRGRFSQYRSSKTTAPNATWGDISTRQVQRRRYLARSHFAPKLTFATLHQAALNPQAKDRIPA
jgi:hypothetical protein